MHVSWDEMPVPVKMVERMSATPAPAIVLLPLESWSLYSPRLAPRKCTP